MRRESSLEDCHAGFELVGDAEEARLLAALNKRHSKLKWRRRYNKDVPSDTGLCTPYGWLEVRGGVAGGFNVYRNDEPLCHNTCRVQPGCDRSRWPSLFVTRTATEAAAELHMAQGWGDDQRQPDCLGFEWQVQSQWPKRPQRIVCASDVADEHRHGLEVLRRLCHPWGYPLDLTRIAPELSHPTLPQEVWADFALPATQPVSYSRRTTSSKYGVFSENQPGASRGQADTRTPYVIGKVVSRLEMDSRWALACSVRALLAERDALRGKLEARQSDAPS
jgi:hypothetical protein